MLKYGSGSVAIKFGKELADAFFNTHYDIIVSKNIVVMESAYAHMRNAASLVTDAFTDRLNDLIVEFNGKHVERTKINRIVPYIADYGKLSAKKRMKLLRKDTFTLDADFVKNKFMIFIDDIFITGTHQMKIEEMVESYGFDFGECMCVYYAELTNSAEDPAIESFLNESSIRDLDGLSSLISRDVNYRVIVRTVKMILAEPDTSKMGPFLCSLSDAMVNEIYMRCLGEGYYKNPAFSTNFAMLRDDKRRRLDKL